jgi:hypothetical protein
MANIGLLDKTEKQLIARFSLGQDEDFSDVNIYATIGNTKILVAYVSCSRGKLFTCGQNIAQITLLESTGIQLDATRAIVIG